MPLPFRTIFRRLSPLWIGLYFAALTVVVTYPLVLNLSTQVIGSLGDNIYFVWLVRWYQQVIFEGRGHLFFNPWMNYPEGWNLSTTDTTLASALPGTFFSLFFGPVAGYNLAMLLSFFLSGLSMFIWVRHLTRRTDAALLAGTIYAFLPYHGAHFIVGHLNLSGMQWFPLYFMGLYDLLRAEPGRHWWLPGLLAGISLGLIAFTSMYYLYMTLLMSAVFVAGHLLFNGWRWLTRTQFWKGAGVFALSAAAPLLLALRPFLLLSGQGSIASRSVEYASMYSASPLDFFLPSTDHFLFGKWVGANFDRSLWIEATLYIGIVALVLTILALLLRRHTGHAGLVLTALLTALAAFVLALGTDLHWNAQTVIWQVPAFLQPLIGKSETAIRLPAYYLFVYLPFYAKMRALMRIGLFTLLFTSLLAGLGGAALLERVRPNRRLALAGLLLVLAIFDFYPGPYTSFSIVQPRPVDSWLAAQPGEGGVVQMPFKQSEDQKQIFYTLYHGKPFTGGFFNANQPPQYVAIKPVLDSFPSGESVALLRELKVEYVVVDIAAYTDYSAVEAQILSLGLQLLTEQDGQRVYHLSPSQ